MPRFAVHSTLALLLASAAALPARAEAQDAEFALGPLLALKVRPLQRKSAIGGDCAN